jgi:glycosyltransferase involved in cell wall biosynthesis
MDNPDNQYGRKRTKKRPLIAPAPPLEPPAESESRQIQLPHPAEKTEAQLPMELPSPPPPASTSPANEQLSPLPIPEEPKVEPKPKPLPEIKPEPELQAQPEPKIETKPEPKTEPRPELKPEARKEIPQERPRRDQRRPERTERIERIERPDRTDRPDRGDRFRQQPMERKRETPPQVPQGAPLQPARPKDRPQPKRFGVERGKVRVSIIIPAYNEEGNIKPLMDQFHEVVARAGNDWEVILVDDGSTDKTAERARDASIHYHWLRVVSYSRNKGLTSALDTGFRNARGSIYVFYPADMQYHPQEIPKMIARIDRGADIVTGWKQGKYNKKFVSAIYNYLCRALFGIKVHDLNSVKAFKKEVLDKIRLRQDWHRYMVVLAAEEGYVVDEVKVNVFPRYSGQSKFGTGRILGGLLDLLSVKFQISFTKKPLRFFGTWGLFSILLGVITGLVAIYLRLFTIHGSRTWLYAVILFILSGLLLFSLGFLAEVIVAIREEIESLKQKK